MVVPSKPRKPDEQTNSQIRVAPTEETPQSGVTRRDFLKYSAGAAVVAAAASQLIPSLGLPSTDVKSLANKDEGPSSRPTAVGSGPAIVFVDGEEMRIFSGESEVTVRDSSLASSIVRKFGVES